jgi:hypothetical protein
MATEKAIINISNSVVALSQGRLPPGGIFKVRDYYRDESGLRTDLTLQRFISGGYVQVQDIDFEAMAQVKARNEQAERDHHAGLAQAAVDDSATREAEHQAREEAKLLAEGMALEGARLAREQAIAARMAPRPVPQPEDDLLALFEKGRKERLERAMADRQTAQEPPPSTEAVQVDPQAVPAPEASYAPRMLEEPTAESYPMVQDEEPVTVVERKTKPPEPIPVPVPTVAEILEGLDDKSMRKVLDLFEVKDRKKLKTRAALAKAIEKLELDPEDLQRLLTEEK